MAASAKVARLMTFVVVTMPTFWLNEAVGKKPRTDPKMLVQMPGGTMELEIEEDGTVLLTGDVGFVGTMKLGSTFVEQLRSFT